MASPLQEENTTKNLKYLEKNIRIFHKFYTLGLQNLPILRKIQLNLDYFDEDLGEQCCYYKSQTVKTL
jgi:hypothetical protein